MSLNAALQFFKDIAATKGSTAKLAKLELANETEKRILVYALDPYRMYGIKNFTAKVTPNPEVNPEFNFFHRLDQLVAREATGHSAVSLVLNMILNQVPEELIRMVLEKDLRCGLGATSVNKVFPDLIPEFKVALAKNYEDDGVWPKRASIKHDGLRGLAFVTPEGVEFKTRNGLLITSVEHLHEPLFRQAWAKGLVFDGEVKLKKGHFQETSGAARKKSENNPNLAFYIFDWLPIEEFLARESTMTQDDRLARLEEWAPTLVGDGLVVVPHPYVKNDTEAQRMYKQALADKEEGLILKRCDAPYEFRRSDAWVKMKDVKDADCRVKGIIPGKGKYEGMVGALVVDFEGLDDKVGSGISDADRQLWADNPDLILNKIIQVNYHEKTKDGHMRHSRFDMIRWDKE